MGPTLCNTYSKRANKSPRAAETSNLDWLRQEPLGYVAPRASTHTRLARTDVALLARYSMRTSVHMYMADWPYRTHAGPTALHMYVRPMQVLHNATMLQGPARMQRQELRPGRPASSRRQKQHTGLDLAAALGDWPSVWIVN